uniref:Uncharacterized protein n=1 Tax=Opuntia streptacantha TaxID=393608 RepID=A0A7C8Z029_OPUST
MAFFDIKEASSSAAFFCTSANFLSVKPFSSTSLLCFFSSSFFSPTRVSPVALNSSITFAVSSIFFEISETFTCNFIPFAFSSSNVLLTSSLSIFTWSNMFLYKSISVNNCLFFSSSSLFDSFMDDRLP